MTLHENLFDLLMHGDGKWDWNTLYNLPVFLRKFWIYKINKKTTEHNERIAKQNNSVNHNNKIAKPPF